MSHTRSIINDHLVKSGKSPTPENIRSFINKNRKKIKNLIKEYKEINWENFEILDFISFVREKFELPSQIPLDSFIKLITYSVTTWNTLDYDWLLKLIPQDTKKSDNLKIVKKDKLIKNQWEHLAQWLVEIIANACDASNPEVQVGRFWEGFFQSLRFLQEFENAKLSINTKKQGEKAFEISLVEEKNEVKVWSLSSKKQENWTIVSLAAKLDNKTVSYLNDFISSRFGTNPYINLYLNWKRLNDLEKFVYINWQKLDTSLLPVVNITLNESWFIAEDFWVGMDSKTICEKLLIPTSSSKLRTKMDAEETKKYASEHTRFFYKREKDKWKKTTVRLQVAGVVNEEFECETNSDISVFSLETPFFEWVPEAKNQVLPTRWVVLTIENAISKIFNKCETLEEKVELSEIVWKIISKLKERKTNETEKKYTLDYISREAFKPFLKELEESGKIVLPAWDELQKIVWENENVIFVSPDFVNFDITSLLGVKKIDWIIWETKPFYAIEFSPNATHDYLIHKSGILVNSKYLSSNSDSNISPIQILNASVNLNTYYEIKSDIVFYGRIDKDNLALSEPQKTTKKSNYEVFSQNQFIQDNKELALDKNSEEYEKMLEEKRQILKKVLEEFVEEFEEGLKVYCEIVWFNFSVIKRTLRIILENDKLILKVKNPNEIITYILFWTFLDEKISENFINKLRQKTIEIQWNIFYFMNIFQIYSYKQGMSASIDLSGINKEIKDFVLNKIGLDKYIELIDKIFELFEIEPEFMTQLTKRLGGKNNWKRNDTIFEIQKIINELEHIKETWEFPNQNTTKILVDDTEYTQIEDLTDPKFAVFMEDEDVKTLMNWDMDDQDEWSIAEERILFKFQFNWNADLRYLFKKYIKGATELSNDLLSYEKEMLYAIIKEHFESWNINFSEFEREIQVDLKKEILRKIDSSRLGCLFELQYIIYQLKKNWFVKKEVEVKKKKEIPDTEYTHIEDIMDPKFAFFMEDEDVKNYINWNYSSLNILKRIRNKFNLSDIDEFNFLKSINKNYSKKFYKERLWIDWEKLFNDFIKRINCTNLESFIDSFSLSYWYDPTDVKFNSFCETQKLIFFLKKGWNVKKEVEEDEEIKVWENETIFEPLYTEYYKNIFDCFQYFAGNLGKANYHNAVSNLNVKFWYDVMSEIQFSQALIEDFIVFSNNSVISHMIKTWDIIYIKKRLGQGSKYWEKARDELENYWIDLAYYQIWTFIDFLKIITPTPELKKRCLELQQEKHTPEDFQVESLSDPKYKEFMNDMKAIRETKKLDWNHNLWSVFEMNFSYKYPWIKKELFIWIMDYYRSLLSVNSTTDKNIIKDIRNFTDEKLSLWKWDMLHWHFNEKYPSHKISWNQLLEQVIIYLLEKNLPKKSVPESSSIMTQIDETIDKLRAKLREYPQDLVAFGEFLDKGWEFLKSEESLIKVNWDKKFKLSELIAGYRLHNRELEDIDDEENLEDFIGNIQSKNYNWEFFNNEIRSSIDGQDESAMIWVRELVQNSRDAILGSGISGKIEINFYEEDGNWVSSVSDPVWMNLKQIFNYLLVPGESSKTWVNSEGMFGQGFYATTIESREIRVKSWVGDWKTTSLVFKPIFNEWWLIHDFEISYEILDEDFKWTLVERVDKSSWIWGNLRALIGVHNIQKYVWNVDDVEILYKWESIANSKELLETVAVPEYWEIKIFETSDKIERKTKNNLFVRDLPDDYLDDLPDWMSKFIKSRNISIEIPAGMQLTKTRNSLAQREKNLPILKPYLFKAFVGLLLKSFVNRNTGIKIPMLPEDYLSLKDEYFNYSRQITKIADKYNSGKVLNEDEIEILKNDSERMAQFLIQANFEYKWKTTNLREMKQDILSKNRIESNSDTFNEMQDQSFLRSDSLNRWMEDVPRDYNPSIEEMSEKLWVSIDQIKKFNDFMENNFLNLASNLYWWKFINGYYQRDWWENRAAMYRKIGWNIYMYWNIDYIKNWILDFENPETQEKIIETTTHEIVHLLENRDKLGSHEKDLEHDKSFERIQRNLLTTMQRI